MKRNILLFLMSLLPMLASANYAYIDGIWYILSENEATVTYDYSLYSGAVIIPKSVTYNSKTYSVTGIDNGAFRLCTSLTSITIPESVTSIGKEAFEGCSSLTSITIPNSVTSIGSDAFYGCSGLTSATIGSGVTSIGFWAFGDCTSLTSIIVGMGNTKYDSRNSCNAIIETATNTLIAGCMNTVIPESVSSIGDGAFSGCSSLVSITIGSGVTSIGEYAFSNCTALTSVTIPESVTSIGSDAFYGCTGLTSVTIPESVTSIGSSAFGGCKGLTSVTIPNSVTTIGSYAFSECTGLTSITIGSGLTSIANSPFWGCTNLKYVTIENGVTSIGEDAFSDCSSLTSITIPNSVTNIGSYAFSGCSGLKSITIPNSVTSISNGVFRGCTGLTSVTIPESVNYIGGSTFEGCTSLTSITIPNSVTEINNYTFEGCTGMTFITIPESVTSIGEDAFRDCKGLKSVTIPNSVTSIGEDAFSGCSNITSLTLDCNSIENWFGDCHASLKTLTLGDNVKTIKFQAFDGCSGLTSVTIPSSVTNIGSYAFRGCSGLKSITIPNSVTIISNNAFGGCTGLTSVTIPESVTYIGEDAFNDCKGLKSVTIPNSVTRFASNAFAGCSNIISLSLDCKSIGNWFSSSRKSLKNLTLGANVKIIGDNAFSNCTGLTSVTIPDSVTIIGRSAFSGCSGLTSVTIGSGVKSIDSFAFLGCKGLTSVTIPNSVTSIGARAFEGCSGLTSVTIGSGVASIGIFAFKDCSSLQKVIVPDIAAWCGIKFELTILDPLYYSNPLYYTHHLYSDEETEITNLVIPEGVTSIGEYAFIDCTGLKSVTIPNSVTSIGGHAFEGCTGLKSITIPESMTTIGDYAFKDCSSLQKVIVPDIAAWCGIKFKYLSSNPLYYTHHLYCDEETEITNLTIPEGVTSIGDHAFGYCTGLTSVTIPNSVTSIGDNAFWYCSSLTSITIPESVAFIGDDAFTGTAWIKKQPDGLLYVGKFAYKYIGYMPAETHINIKEGTLGIVGGAFDYCSRLTSITIPESVTYIGGSAFNYCSGLTSITIPNSVTSIGRSAFRNCSSLTSVTIPENVTSIEAYTFEDCTSLTSVTIPLGVTDIGRVAFSGCTSLTSVTIPNSVTSIDLEAFYGCSGLTSVTSKIIEPFPISMVFDNNTENNATLYVPIGTFEAYKSASGWRDFSNIIEMEMGTSMAICVTDENGTDVSNKVNIFWYNERGKLIGTGKKINGVEKDSKVYYSVMLDEDLGCVYREVKMQKVIASNNPVSCKLEKIGQVMLEGRVSATDIDKTTMTVNIKQMLNGKWEQTYTTQTNEQGIFQVEVYDDETEITISGEGYLDASIHRDGFNGNGNVGTIPVSLISGFAIAANITMQEATVAKEVTAWTDGINNIEFSLTNTTKGISITDFTVQNGNVIIKSGADLGDEISLTAKSKQGIFADAITSFTIEEGANTFDLRLTELGGFDAICDGSSNSSTLGYLYDSNGVLAAKGSYVGETLSLRHIQNGVYTLVSMGNSMLFGNMTHLSDLSAIGLNEGTDYITIRIAVVDGELTIVNVDEIPPLNDTRFYYTNNNTYFNANKSSVTAGNYLTLQAHVDFKSEYAEKADGVTLTIHLPEGCQMVENSVIANHQLVAYSMSDNSLTMLLNKEQYESQIRFCIIPTLNQSYAITAMAAFDINGLVQQPIGTAQFEAKGLSLNTPQYASNANITINGNAGSHSDVSIYDNDVLIGKTTSKADGSWTAECELFNPYNHSFHDIYAKITTENGMKLISDIQHVEYNKNYLVPEKVTMIFYNDWMKKNIDVEFNLLEGTTTPSSYPFYHGTDFTFLADFTSNDSTLIKNVNIKVLNSDGTVRTLPAIFDGKLGKWVATTKYSSASRLPENVLVEYDAITRYNDEDREVALQEQATVLASCASLIGSYFDTNVEMTAVDEGDDYVLLECNTGQSGAPFYYRIENVDYQVADNMMKVKQFVYAESGDGVIGTFTEIGDNSITVYVVDALNSMACKMTVYMSAVSARAYAAESNTPTTTTTNAAIMAIRENVGSGRILDDFLGYFGDVVDLLTGIKEYWNVKGDFDNLCNVILNFSDNLEAANKKTFSLSMAKCPDGSYRLSQEEMAKYFKAIQSVQNLESSFRDQYYLCLEQYKTKLRLSVATYIGTLGLGKALGTISKVSKFVNSPVNRWFNNTLNKHFSSYVFRTTSASILSSVIGTGIGAAVGWGTEKLDKIFSYKDFNGVRDKTLSWSSEEYCKLLQDYTKLQDGMKRAYKKCDKKENKENEQEKKDEPLDEKSENKPEFIGKGSTPEIDPSGYVYEAVLSNRLEGVTTTCYQKVQVEDMYGDITEEAVVWNAEDYSQENPLKTDATGFYRWDVPQGMWQVKYEKEGYETAYSDWLPVPPPQLDVNIGMKQSTPPTVKQMRGYESGITIETTKYMHPETMSTGNITVTRNGKDEKGHIELMNEEKAPLGEETYVSKVKFIPQNRFSTSDIVVVTVHKEVKSYCGVNMENDHVETVKIEPEITSIEADSVITVPYQGEKTLKVMILPKEASAGKKLNVKTSSSMIASVSTTNVTIDRDGAATLTIGGELPGGAVLDFTVDDTDVTATSKVQVKLKVDLISAPTANILSGETIDIGTKIELYCETEDAVIYYTTDGSCPCNETTRKRYNGPIVINDNTTIKAMAVTPDMVESDVVEFVYFINDDEDTIEEISLNGVVQIYPLPVRDQLNVTANGEIVQNVTVSAMNGMKVASSTKPSAKVSIDVRTIPTGIYIINIVTKNGVYSRKILKVE